MENLPRAFVAGVALGVLDQIVFWNTGKASTMDVAFLVVVLVIFGFQAFGQVEILTGGGPAGATETLVYKIFNNQQPLDQGEGAVMAIGLFGITFVVSLLQIGLLERRVHYGG